MRRFSRKNLGKREIELSRMLENRGMDIFSIQDLTQVSDYPISEIELALHHLVKAGEINRLEKGKFCRHNFRDELVIGSYISKGVVSYWSALHFHGMTEQLPNIVYIQTNKRKKDKTIFGVDYHFITLPKMKIAGTIKHGVGNHQFFITNMDKTMVDCFDLTQYAGAYGDLVAAFLNYQPKMDSLIKYCKLINNSAAIRRIGFWMEVFDKSGIEKFKSFTQEYIPKSYAKLDPSGGDEGKYNSKWRLLINVDTKRF